MKTIFVGMTMALTLMLGATAGAAWARDNDKILTTQAARMDRYTTSRGQTVVSDKTAADFSSFYGQDNSQSLAEGLRSGSKITLTTPASNGTLSTATFTPPTGNMGNGNVYISMALAQQQLTSAGITQPTAQQIQTAMVGGTLVPGGQPVDGVLQMRASGMGWGQIANSLGVKLGRVIGGMKSANAALSRTIARTGTTPKMAGSTSTAAGKTKTSTGTGKSGIVSAGGSGGANVVGGSKASGEKSGIMTGAGGAAGDVASPAGGGKSQGQGVGIVTGGGGVGGGQGKAYGKGGK